MPKKPHIVIFNPDSWRGDVVGHAGNAAAVTPNLDAMAATDSVSFTRTFSQNPVCTPSRCSFMTGWYPHVRGHRTMLHMLQPDEPNLLRQLKDLGYYVWWGGKNDLLAVKERDDYLDSCHVKYQSERGPTDLRMPATLPPDDPRFYAFHAGTLSPDNEGGQYHDPDGKNVAGAVDLIRNPPDDQPMCIYLPLGAPHPPYLGRQEFVDQIDRTKLPPRVPPAANPDDAPLIMKQLRDIAGSDAVDEAAWEEIRVLYYAMCARVDQLFGQVVDALKEAGIYEDTAIFFFSDHGDFTGDYSMPEKTHGTLQDCLVHVPFLIKPPASMPIQSGTREQLVELVDFPATVADLLDVNLGHPHFGRSLLPMMADPDIPHRDAVFAEVGCHAGEMQARNSEVSDIPPTSLYWPQVQLGKDGSQPMAYGAMCRTDRYKLIRRLEGVDELYDMENDPGETTNLVDRPEHAATVQLLQLRLLDFYMATADVVPYEQDSRRV